jgi:hypothetical protein
MKLLIVFCSCILLFCCKKNEQAPYYAGYYGHWQFIGYGFGGPVNNTPSPDSVVLLILIPGNTYQITLNGLAVTRRSFSINPGTNGTVLTFNNITQLAGTDTVVVAGNLSYFFYNFIRIGKLTLFQYDHPFLQGDSLVLTQESTGFEYATDYFRKIP